ncbi:MAG: response regulator [Candidatus Thorarchaeota archaeon]
MKVIIAGDVPLLRSLVRMAVEEAGYDVIGEPETPDELLAMCSSHRVSIIVLDFMMTEGERMRIIEKILDIDAKISIIAVADIVEDFGNQVLVAGARAYIQKPFSMYDLLDMMRKVEPVL